MRLSMFVTAMSLCLIVAVVHAQPATSPALSGDYHIETILKIGGPGRWDYVAVGDDHLLYVTRSTHEQIIDPGTGKIVADIDGGTRLHGTAVVPGIGRAFVTDGGEAKLLVIDTKSYKLLGKIDAADDADGVIYDSGSKRVLVACGDAGQLLVLDPALDIDKAKVEKVDLDGKPEFLTADGKGRAFVCINDKNLVAVVDLKTLKVVDRWPLGSGTGPAGITADAKSGRLFVGCRNEKCIVMDSSTGKVLAELPIGRGNDACAFDENAGLAFASCGDGTTAVIAEPSPGTFVVKQTLATPMGSRTIAVDSSTHMLYLPTVQFAPAEQGKRPAPLPDTFGIVVARRDSWFDQVQ